MSIMAVHKQNSRRNKSKTVVRKRNHVEKSTQRSSARSLAELASSAATRKHRQAWNQATRLARIIISQGNRVPSDEDLPERNQIILIDACNVGYGFGPGFSAEGVRLAICSTFSIEDSRHTLCYRSII